MEDGEVGWLDELKCTSSLAAEACVQYTDEVQDTALPLFNELIQLGMVYTSNHCTSYLTHSQYPTGIKLFTLRELLLRRCLKFGLKFIVSWRT